MQEQIGNLQSQMAGVLGLHRTTSRVSLTSLPGSVNTKKAYKRFCKNLLQMGVTSDMIAQREGDILNMLNQPQDIDTGPSVRGNGSGNNSAQLITVSYPFQSGL